MAGVDWDRCPDAVRSQVVRLLRGLQRLLGEELVGLYLHGSLAMGCFNPDRSDVDLLAVVRSPLGPPARLELARLLLELSGKPRPMEISFLLEASLKAWRHPLPYELHYSEDWRARFEQSMADPAWELLQAQERCDVDLAAHLTVLWHRGIRIAGPPIRALFPQVPREDYLDAILSDVRWAADGIVSMPVYAVLNLCRVWRYLQEGAVCSKAEGGTWACSSADLPADLKAVVERVLRLYRGEEPDAPWDEGTLRRFAAFAAQQVRELAPGREPDREELACLRCGTPMNDGGPQWMQLNPALAPLALRIFWCPSCSKVEFFLDKQTEPSLTDDLPHEDWSAWPAGEAQTAPGAPGGGEATECLSCGALIPATQNSCPRCGWTWR